MALSDSESRSASPAGSVPADSPEASSSTPASGSPVETGATAMNSTTETARTKNRESTGAESAGAAKITKRRAARACVSCRARKVRCDVVEGAPCGNCRWDNVTCVVQESRRRKKNIFANPSITGATGPAQQTQQQSPYAEALSANGSKASNPISISSAEPRRTSNVSTGGIEAGAHDSHVPHLIYQRTEGYHADSTSLLSKLGDANRHPRWSDASLGQPGLVGDLRTVQFLASLEEPDVLGQLPPFVKPLPSKIEPDDVAYLQSKGALSLPNPALQNALLKAYAEYVHPYMPLLELNDFLNKINSADGVAGQVSLFLYQAVMFVGTAFVDIKHLRDAGFENRRTARRIFFQRTRLLYDFDYESDRLALVQALLLMTYWYETPDDQKDTWHWMGVAISLAHTIGLHRNPMSTSMPRSKQKLWKRIWWSCFMRDRLVALGMRRPTRIKDEDFDVPMLEESDFELEALPDENKLLGPECPLVRDVGMQQQLAQMCIEKAKLCIIISHMLKAQYSVLSRDHMRPENTSSSTMMLLPNKTMANAENVNMVDLELITWLANLPPYCQYRALMSVDIEDGNSTIAVQRNLLHMVYQTTVSALHRPQFLTASPSDAPAVSRQVQEMSRTRVRDAASHITQMAAELHHLRIERFLPTTGVTVILPAMIIHLLDMKNPIADCRATATRGFRQCMKVMEKLRDIYAAADFATGFLDAALRKAALDSASFASQQQQQQQQHHHQQIPTQLQPQGRSLDRVLAPGLNLGQHQPPQSMVEVSTPPPENLPYLNSTEANLYHHDQTYLSRDANGNTTVVRAPSPPHTDQESDSSTTPTPPASGLSEHSGMDVEFDHGNFEWNTISGKPLDFDQWLQFPAEGVNNSDESFMGIFAGPPEDRVLDSMDWVETA